MLPIADRFLSRSVVIWRFSRWFGAEIASLEPASYGTIAAHGECIS
jgi:hypothetical protein